MPVALTPEERRKQIQYSFNEITARAAEDRAWLGNPAERDLVQEFAALSHALRKTTDWASAIYLRSVLLDRAGEWREAERELAAVRANQDSARESVAALLPKARVTGRYRYLPGRLASLRYRLKDGAAAVFDAIEWAKSRALSDVAGDDGTPDFAELSARLMQHGLHYITYLLDETQSFAVLVTKDGTAEVARASVGYDDIEPFGKPEKISPAGRGSVLENPLARKGDWTKRLSALAELVDAAFAQGRMRRGDTLLISPHGSLHLFPLHALRLKTEGGRAIGEMMATVRVHGAAEVIRRMATGVHGPLRDAMVLWAPLVRERNDATYAASIARCRALLRQRLGTEPAALEAEGATADAATRAFGPNRILHFSCHGDMIAKGPRDRRSFLMLAQDGRLAERQPSAEQAPDGALTAASVLAWAHAEAGRTLQGTHVTLQACVSGHAAANPQGDAVGLEWAFLMAGAASTIGTHWHVDLEDATVFMEAFYEAWLGGNGRAGAWAAAGAALRQTRGGGAWEAFSLTGEWR